MCVCVREREREKARESEREREMVGGCLLLLLGQVEALGLRLLPPKPESGLNQSQNLALTVLHVPDCLTCLCCLTCEPGLACLTC